MSEFRYNANSRALEEDLVEILSDAARETAVKEAEAESKQRDAASGGLARIAAGKTPLDEVRAILAQQQTKSAEQEISEHRVRRELRKVASRNQRFVEKFLTEAKGG